MANSGFSAKRNFWGTISGLSPKTSSDGNTNSVAEALDEYGDPQARDVYGEVFAPSVEYAVTESVSLSSLALGSVVTYGSGEAQKKFMMTQVVVNTSAGSPPTVTISGVQVESDATSLRTYALSGTVTPRARAQDVVGAFTSSDSFSQITTTFSVDPHVQTVAGTPVKSDASHVIVEVAATMTDPTGSATIEAATGFTLTAVQAQNDPDADYQTKTATATKSLTGAEPVASLSMQGDGNRSATVHETGGEAEPAETSVEQGGEQDGEQNAPEEVR